MMSELTPSKLHVKFGEGVTEEGPILPRTYTLTHSDVTGDLYLTVAQTYNKPQISGWYTRLMRDEVLAQWKVEDDLHSLHVYCHVSGGLLFGTAGWREAIFRYHMPMVLESFRYGDRKLIESNPELDEATIWVHFHRARSRKDKVKKWGKLKDFRLESFSPSKTMKAIN
jgi:hypothetical protein